VLEFAGEAFAMDPGICEYEDPNHVLMKQCQSHNMLVPIGMNERPSPKQPILVDVKAVGKGNRKSVHAKMDVTPGWETYYRRWVRSWDSSTPDVLTITDEYELNEGTGVDFLWQTVLPCEVNGQRITIKGSRASLVLEAPSDCSVRVDVVPGSENATRNRIAIRKSGASGTLRVAIRLQGK
jgi:hypothetical protein